MQEDVRGLRALSWNVFEDGLADAPTAIGFTQQYTDSMNTLLAELSADAGKGCTTASRKRATFPHSRTRSR